MFFMLSGFVLAFSYEDRLRNRMSFREFLLRRFIRLYPMIIAGSVAGLFSSIDVTNYITTISKRIRTLFHFILINNTTTDISYPFWKPDIPSRAG